MGVPAEQPGTLKQSIFTQDITGQQVHCQIVHLGKQVYVWLGTAGGSPQGGLYAAVPFKGVCSVYMHTLSATHSLTIASSAHVHTHMPYRN